jgi:hypothetical protein
MKIYIIYLTLLYDKMSKLNNHACLVAFSFYNKKNSLSVGYKFNNSYIEGCFK